MYTPICSGISLVSIRKSYHRAHDSQPHPAPVTNICCIKSLLRSKRQRPCSLCFTAFASRLLGVEPSPLSRSPDSFWLVLLRQVSPFLLHSPHGRQLVHTFHCFATASFNGSSGLGAPRRACMLNRIVRICKAGDQLFFSTSRQIRPNRSMLG